jgi:hypothetical protein
MGATIGFATLLFIAVLYSAYRRAAWGTAALGFALGLVLAGTSGPIQNITRGLLNAVGTVFTAIGSMLS